MKRMMKSAVVILTLMAAMTTTASAKADSLWGALINLTDSDPSTWVENFEIWNNTGRKINLKIDHWEDYIPGHWAWHSVGGGTLLAGETAGIWNAHGTYRIRLRIWNSNTKKWVLKDQLYVHSPGPYFIEAYKAGQHDFRLRRW